MTQARKHFIECMTDVDEAMRGRGQRDFVSGTAEATRAALREIRERVRKAIAAAGGPRDIAREIGVSHQAVVGWGKRGSVPPRWQGLLRDAARSRGFVIEDSEMLARPRRGWGSDLPVGSVSLFMDKVSPEPNTGCWLWMAGGGGEKGFEYGSFLKDGRVTPAHRASWEFFKGPISEGLVVRHKCDTPCCVNPDHLVLGTQIENIADRDMRDRVQHGERHVRAKLTEREVLEIRHLHRMSDLSHRKIAQRFGISPANVSTICRGESWKRLIDKQPSDVAASQGLKINAYHVAVPRNCGAESIGEALVWDCAHADELTHEDVTNEEQDGPESEHDRPRTTRTH